MAQKKKRPPTAQVELKVRLRESLRAKVEKSADAKDVSLNSEAVTRLEESFRWEQTIEALAAMVGGVEQFWNLMSIGRQLHFHGVPVVREPKENETYPAAILALPYYRQKQTADDALTALSWGDSLFDPNAGWLVRVQDDNIDELRDRIGGVAERWETKRIDEIRKGAKK